MTADYNPRTHEMMTFHDLVPAFRTGSDSPRALLERCLEAIAACEGEIMAWEVISQDAARAAADAATARYMDGRALSPVDGLPISVAFQGADYHIFPGSI